MALSFVVTGTIWAWILNPTSGINVLIEGTVIADLRTALLDSPFLQPIWGVLDSLRINILRPGLTADPRAVIGAIAVAAVWQMSGFVMALYLAGLRAINDELREAARVDGASEGRMYRHIVLPLLRPITISAIVLLGYVSLKMFDLVFVLTRGGPALSSDLPSIFMFDTTFRNQTFAQGAAVATIMFVISAVLIVPYVIWASFGTASRDDHLADRWSARSFDGGRIAGQVPASKPPLPRPRRAGDPLPRAPVRRGGRQPQDLPGGEHDEHLDAAGAAQPDGLHGLAHATAGQLGRHRQRRQQPRHDHPGRRHLRDVGIGHGLRPEHVALLARGRLRAHPLRSLHPVPGDPHPPHHDAQYVKLYDSLAGLAITHILFGLPIVTLIFRNFYAAIPSELMDAARVDGAASGASSGASSCRSRCPLSSWSASGSSLASGTSSSSR